MTSHKQLRRIGKECRAYAEIIIAWIATDMFDEHIHIFTLKTVQLTIHQPKVSPVAVATDSPERSEGSQFLCHLHAPDIPGMPDLITRFEVVQILIVPICVGVAENTNPLHSLNFFLINSAMSFSVSSNPSMLASIHRS